MHSKSWWPAMWYFYQQALAWEEMRRQSEIDVEPNKAPKTNQTRGAADRASPCSPDIGLSCRPIYQAHLHCSRITMLSSQHTPEIWSVVCKTLPEHDAWYMYFVPTFSHMNICCPKQSLVKLCWRGMLWIIIIIFVYICLLLPLVNIGRSGLLA